MIFVVTFLLLFFLINGLGDKCCSRVTTLQTHTEVMPGLPSLGDKRWAHPLPLATWSLLELGIGTCHPASVSRDTHLTVLYTHMPLADTSPELTGLARGRQLSGPLPPLPLSHLNGVFSVVHDIKSGTMIKKSFPFFRQILKACSLNT